MTPNYYHGLWGNRYANYGTPALNESLASQGNNAPSGPSFAQIYAAQSQENQANRDHQIAMVKLQQQGDLDKMKLQGQLNADARSDAQDFAAKQQAQGEQFQAGQAGEQRFTNLLEEGGREYEQEAGRAQQGQQFEESRADRANEQTSQQDFAAQQTDAEGQIQSGLLQQRQGYDAQRDQYQHGAAMDTAQQKAALDVWVNQRQMTNAEMMEHQRLDNMVSSVWNDPKLSDEEKVNIVGQMKYKVDIGKQRMENTRAQQIGQMNQIQMAQEAQKYRVMEMNSQDFMSQIESHRYVSPNGTEVYHDPVDGKMHVVPPRPQKDGDKPMSMKDALSEATAHADAQIPNVGQKSSADEFWLQSPEVQQMFRDKVGTVNNAMGKPDANATDQRAASAWAAQNTRERQQAHHGIKMSKMQELLGGNQQTSEPPMANAQPQQSPPQQPPQQPTMYDPTTQQWSGPGATQPGSQPAPQQQPTPQGQPQQSIGMPGSLPDGRAFDPARPETQTPTQQQLTTGFAQQRDVISNLPKGQQQDAYKAVDRLEIIAQVHGGFTNLPPDLQKEVLGLTKQLRGIKMPVDPKDNYYLAVGTP